MRLLGFILLFLFGHAFAQTIPMSNALSFAPPATDVSLMFLGNIFGVVDGVLAGYGSQIFGRMMSVLNSAVLALGSIVSTYVLLLGTMHTAHEGEFLGKKWSSILIPIRTTLGLSLLIPKSSGYCLIQVFFIWVIVQGVGAGDKIWSAALLYLNEGGKVFAEQPSSRAISGTSNQPLNPTYDAGIKILAGQVCMKGIELFLKGMQQQANNNPNIKNLENTANGKLIKQFLSVEIPDFLGSVDAVAFASANANMNPFVLPMPNFQNGMFTTLNGICGAISWKNLDLNFQSGGSGNIYADTNLNITYEQANALKQTRSIAVQTMYSFLTNVAIAMVNNNPYFSYSIPQTTTATYYANLQYGAPNQNGNIEVCKSVSTLEGESSGYDGSYCSSWGPASGGGNVSVLFTGNEFSNAIKAYDAVMAPVLNLKKQMEQNNTQSQLRNFIQTSNQTGWMFAGAYFFNLVALSGDSLMSTGLILDDDSGLDATQGPSDPGDKTVINLAKVVASKCLASGEIGSLCWYINSLKEPLKILDSLLVMIRGGSKFGNGCQTTLQLNSSKTLGVKGYVSPVDALNRMDCSSTVYGFVGNSFYFNIPIPKGSGITTPSFYFPQISITPFYLQDISIDCSGIFCIPSAIVELLWNGVFIPISNFLQGPLDYLLSQVLEILYAYPLTYIIWPMLQDAILQMSQNYSNPVIQLANMGGHFIQKTIETFLSLLGIAGIAAVFSGLGMAITVLLSLTMPFLTAWLAYFTTIGFTTCFYVPMLPYLIFIFSVLSWFFVVIEAVIAAPLVALSVTTPEGEGVIGKGEQGLMILLNIFLRPSLMVIGFITATGLTYTAIWMLNSSFAISGSFLLGANAQDQAFLDAGLQWNANGYTWPLVLGDVFYISIYVSIYVTLVQKCFTLIYNIPDKVLRWVGGHGESTGQEINQWVELAKQKIEDFSTKTEKAIVSSVGGLQKAAKDISSELKGSQEDDDDSEKKGSVNMK